MHGPTPASTSRCSTCSKGPITLPLYLRVTAERAGKAPLDNTTVHLLRLVEGRVAEVWLHNWDNTTVNEFWS